MDRLLCRVAGLLLALSLSACDLAGDIFDARFWIDVIAVVAIGAVVWAIVRLFD